MATRRHLPLLDGARGAAALYVAIGHVVLHRMPEMVGIRWVWAGGQEAVMIFFCCPAA